MPANSQPMKIELIEELGSLRLAQFALDHAADPIYWVRHDGRIFYANHAACQSLGYSRDELLSMTISDINPDFPKEAWPAHWQKMKKSGRLTFEAHHRTKDGRIFPVEITTNYLTYGSDEFVWDYVRDITKRKRTEVALKESGVRLQAVLETAVDAIITITEDGLITSFNRAAEEIFGYAAEEVVGKNVSMLMPQPDSDNHDGFIRRYLTTGEAKIIGTLRELVGKRKDGSLVPIELAISDIRSESVRGFTGIVRDVTERRRAKEALLESQALYKSLVDHIPQMIFRKDLDGRYTFAGPSFCESLQRPVEEVVGKTDFDFYPKTLAEKYRRDDARVISSGETLEVTEDHQTPGGTTQYVHVIKTPIFDQREQIVGVQVIFWDITQQRHTEEALHQREAELAHAGRLSMMGEMVAGLAHEVNQPVYSIGNFATACENHIERDGPVQTEKLSQWLREISACARRSKEILARLKGFARQSVPQRKSLRIDQAIDESIKMLEFELRDRNVAVDYELAEGIEVWADDVQVQQVFANLIRNACEAFHESGTEDPRLTIRTTQRHGFCEVRVEDNGPGMDGEQIERAFQSFSTTKSAGLGLGLAISRTIVEEHGGKIAIVPNRHRGIACHFTLPLARGDE